MEIVLTNVNKLTLNQEREIASHCSNRTKSSFRAHYLYSRYYSQLDYKMALLYNDNGKMIGWAALGNDFINKESISVQSYIKEKYRKNGYSTLLIKYLLDESKIKNTTVIGCYSLVILGILKKLNYQGELLNG